MSLCPLACANPKVVPTATAPAVLCFAPSSPPVFPPLVFLPAPQLAFAGHLVLRMPPHPGLRIVARSLRLPPTFSFLPPASSAGPPSQSNPLRCIPPSSRESSPATPHLPSPTP